MSKQPPSRLLQPTAVIEDRRTLRVKVTSGDLPAHIRRWADREVLRLGVKPGSEHWKDLLECKGEDVVAQDLAACSLHAQWALVALNDVPEKYRRAAEYACAQMFHAGKRHESFDAQQKYAANVEHSQASKRGYAKAGAEGAATQRKVSDAKLIAAKSEGLTYEDMADRFGMSRNAVAKRFKRLKGIQPPYRG